jgi:hypothetical protein
MVDDEKVVHASSPNKDSWYKRTGWIIALLILFWPVGLYLMWKYTSWNRIVKLVITGLLVLGGISTLAQGINPEPAIRLDNVSNGRTQTDDAEYTVTGSVGLDSDGVKVLVNGKEALWSGDNFSLRVPLAEGDNQIVVKAVKGDKSDEEKFIAHRSTAAELGPKKEAANATPAAEKTEPKTEVKAAPASTVPVEYKSALSKAGSYANVMHMSKRGVYDQLVSEYGEKFSPEAAQYAIDNVKSDWNVNALNKAKTYQDTMHMSPSAIRDQLVSDYGEKFLPAEADYAVQHLNG